MKLIDEQKKIRFEELDEAQEHAVKTYPKQNRSHLVKLIKTRKKEVRHFCHHIKPAINEAKYVPKKDNLEPILVKIRNAIIDYAEDDITMARSAEKNKIPVHFTIPFVGVYDLISKLRDGSDKKDKKIEGLKMRLDESERLNKARLDCINGCRISLGKRR